MIDQTSGSVIYLASRSPRRRILLDQIGIRYKVLSLEIDEHQQENETPEDYVVRMALEKARAGRKMRENDEHLPVLGADTAVVLENDILGKPEDRDDAMAMLARLSDRTHRVLSAVALAGFGVGSGEATRLSISKVTFRELSDEECKAYCATGEADDKAGAYGIQGLAAVYISHLEGSFSGVMGLPLFETGQLLAEAGIRISGS